MKKYTYLILCLLFVALVIAIPELHPQTCHLDGNTLTMLAAGPAFAPLKWNVGQNNMGGYKGRLLFVPFDAPNTVPTVPAPGKAADNEALVTAAGTFAFPADINGKTNCSTFTKHFVPNLILLTQNKMCILLRWFHLFSSFVYLCISLA